MNIPPSSNSEADSNLSFAEMAEKYKWDFTPPSQRSRGALTQDAALGLLDMIKPEDQRAQMAARMENNQQQQQQQQPTTNNQTIDLALDEPPTIHQAI
eukprot:jgi/Psemu1/8061/gm1.8061_g